MIDLTGDEMAVAREILEAAYRDLKEEIYKTEDAHYKQGLKRREGTLESLLAKLSQG